MAQPRDVGSERRAAELHAEVVVVGAGAAGLWAAAGAARAGREVLLLEKTPRTGTKVLASGGTRCNLTTTLDADAARRLFGKRGERFLRVAFRCLSPADLRRRFAALGVATVSAPLEKVFPESGRARDVRDALEREAKAAGVRIVLDAGVTGIEPRGDPGVAASAGWRVAIQGERHALCERLLLSPGGCSYPRTGTTGDGYAWLRALDLPLVEPVPALAPLLSPAAWVRELTGLSLEDVELRLLDAEARVLARRRRPLVFTHRGLSGPGPMDLSVHVARAQAAAGLRSSHQLGLDLMPDVSHEELRAALLAAHGAKGAPLLANCLPRPVPRRLFRAAARAAGLAQLAPRSNELNRSERHALLGALKDLRIPLEGTAGFEAAEVTAGGLALESVDAGSMRVRGFPGLYVCGELLDLDGPIGGLNFQAAFATAELAARDLAG